MSFLVCEECKNWFNTCRNTTNTNDRKCPFCGHYNGEIYLQYSNSIPLKKDLTNVNDYSNMNKQSFKK